ncbi:MAG: divergent polysaccharide deacetylase family protein [Treponema sp.]|nr:divergent polysaccharide deacetylase family protein [Treponema sp.]
MTPEDGIRIAFFTGIFIFTSVLVVLILFMLCSPRSIPEAAGRQPALVPETASAVPPEQPAQPAPPSPAQFAPAAPVEQPPQPAPPPPAQFAPAAPVEQPPRPEPERRGTLVFVIDDAGNNLRELEPFLRFPGPLTIAVLPGLPHSAEAARRIRAAGKEVFLHQPMEALGGQNPGPGAVYLGMSREEVRAVIERNLDEIGPAAGMNNHQGSRITLDEGIMETVLSLCRERGIVFLDSRTIADTAAPQAARRLGMTIGERDVFLDNEQEREAMLRSVSQGLEKAKAAGFAVMIGHTWSPELAAILTELYPDLTGQGYSLTTASQLIQDGGAP